MAAKLGVPEAADRLMIRRHKPYLYHDGDIPVPDDLLLKTVDIVPEELQAIRNAHHKREQLKLSE